MTDTSFSHAQAMKSTHTKLKINALNFWEVLAQAVALISPSMTAALIVPLMFGTAGTAGWLCYLFGTIMLLFVAFSLNQFSKRYTSAGSMYEYTVKGLGPKTGGLSGWCLIWAYMFIGIAGVTGFTHFATKLLALTGATGYLSHPSITLFAVCVLAAWFLAYKAHPILDDSDARVRRHLGGADPDAGVSGAGENRRRRSLRSGTPPRAMA